MIYIPQRLSSFSSFEEHLSEENQIQYQNRKIVRQDSAFFSAFEDQNYQPNTINVPVKNKKRERAGSIKNYEQKKCQKELAQNQVYRKEDIKKINEFQKKIIRLQQQNNKIRAINADLREELESCRNNLREMQKNNENRKQLLREGFMKQQAEGCHKKQKIQTLLRQINKMKQNIVALKDQVNLYKCKSNNLEKQLRYSDLEKETSELKQKSSVIDWQQEFIQIFIDMTSKMCHQIQKNWSPKKKVQIGWKILKNIIQKALNLGVKPPRLQKQVY